MSQASLRDCFWKCQRFSFWVTQVTKSSNLVSWEIHEDKRLRNHECVYSQSYNHPSEPSDLLHQHICRQINKNLIIQLQKFSLVFGTSFLKKKNHRNLKGENIIRSMTSLQVGSRLGEVALRQDSSCRIPLLAQGTRTWACSQDSECFVFCVLVSCLFIWKNKLFLAFSYNKNVMTDKCHCLLHLPSFANLGYHFHINHALIYSLDFTFHLGLFVCL